MAAHDARRRVGPAETDADLVQLGSVVADPVGWIGREQSRLRTVEETAHVLWLGGVTAEQSVFPEPVQLSGLDPDIGLIGNRWDFVRIG